MLRPFPVSHHRDICSHPRWQHSIQSSHHYCRHHHRSVASLSFCVYAYFVCVLCVLLYLVIDDEFWSSNDSLSYGTSPGSCSRWSCSSSSFALETCCLLFPLNLHFCILIYWVFHKFLFCDCSVEERTICIPVLVLFTHDYICYRPTATVYRLSHTKNTEKQLLVWVPLGLACC